MIKKQAEAIVPTELGTFLIQAYSETENDWMPHLAIIAPETDFKKTLDVRIHSECITGEVFHSRKCECGAQLDAALAHIHTHGGMIIYLRQEGRSIGIINKLKAYALQEKGMNTLEANLALGLPADARDFSPALDILRQNGVQSVRLITNNPDKIKFIQQSEILLKDRIPLKIPTNPDNDKYIEVKKKHFGHLF